MAENGRVSDLAVVAVLVPLAYLLGTFPSAELVARRRGIDINAEGSGNPGASNAFRVLGWKAGAVVFGLDLAKGALAALVGLLVAGHEGAFVLGGAAIVGHMLPVTRRFRGGRGVATGAGVVLVVFPLLTLGGAIVWLVVVRLTHKASVALNFGFPRPLASKALLDRVDAWLASTTANPAAVRFVKEGRADVARYLAAQAKDAGQ